MRSYNASMTSETGADRQSTLIRAIPFNELPGQSNLFRDFISGSERIAGFYPNRDTPLNEYCRELLTAFRTNRELLFKMLIDSNPNAGSSTQENIERLRDEDGVAVVTGQQAGLFGGPAYTLHKALSTVSLSRELRSRGINAVPVFWIASEDHDFDEVRQVGSRFGGKFEVPFEGTDGAPVSDYRIDESIEQAFSELETAIPDSLSKEDAIRSLRTHYQPGTAFDWAFYGLLNELLGETGLVFVNPQTKSFRGLAAPIMSEAATRLEEIQTRVLNRGRELAESGFHEQVHFDELSTPFFKFDDAGVRRAITVENGVLTPKGTDESIPLAQLPEMIKENPEGYSPNALLRPVVQDFVLPTVCYFGGAAEVAYFAQNSVIYDVLGRPVTPVKHRSAFTVVSGSSFRTMNSYDLKIEDIWRGKESVLDPLNERLSDPELLRQIESLEGSVKKSLDGLGNRLKEIEPDVAKNLEKREGKIAWHLRSLRDKFVKAQGRRDKDLNRRIDKLFQDLYPDNGLQERSVGVFDLYCEFGPALVRNLLGQTDPDPREHKIVRI